MQKVLFCGTFAPGLEGLIEKYLEKRSKNIKIIQKAHGLIFFESTYSLHELRQLKVFNALYLVIVKLQDGDFFDLSKRIQRVLANKKDTIRSYIKNKKFNLFFFENGKSLKINDEIYFSIADSIRDSLGIHKSSNDGQLDISVIKRSDIGVFAGIKIIKDETIGKTRGMLPFALSYLISWYSEPKPDDVICDPFFGYGGLAEARAKGFPFKKYIISDKSIETKQFMVDFKKKLSNVEFYTSDVMTDGFKAESNTVSRVLTDPPWGDFENIDQIDNLYINIIKEVNRVLKYGGKAVLIVSRDLSNFVSMKASSGEYGKWKIFDRIDILISGKKASILKLEKI